MLGMAVEMHPIAYHEPQGGFAPPDSPSLVRGGACPPLPRPAVHACRAFALFAKVRRGGYYD